MPGSKLARILGLSTADQDAVHSTVGTFKSVAEFLKDLTDAVKGASLLDGLAAALPWQLAAVAGALAEAAPPIKFIAALFERATQIRDPDQLAFLACTTAFQRSVEKALKDFPDRPEQPARALDVIHDIPGPDEGLRFATFSIVEPWSHDFFRLAEALLQDALTAMGFGPDARRRLVEEVRHRFGGELKSLIHHPKTRDRFLSFAESLRFPNVEERTRAAWNDHFDYQRYLFEDRPVFGEEPFSLAATYVNTECGVLTFRDLQDGRACPRAEGPKAGEALTRIDPFNEQVGGRRDVLATVMSLIADKAFSDAIVIQGPAGSGKSAFTHRLAVELLRRGLKPIRIRFRDLPLNYPNIEDALPEAVRFWDPETTARDAPYARPDELFKCPDIFSESTEFDRARICPWVLILDGWDEVSVAADKGFAVRMGEILGQLRDRFLNRPNRPPVRVILTGRPSDVLAEKGVLKKETRILTLRPLKPDTLVAHVHRLASLVADPAHPEQAAPERFAPVLESYAEAFRAHGEQAARVNAPPATMEVLGLPLLTHLAVRLMVRLPGSNLLALVQNPTVLYRHLTDLTCERGGRYGRDAFEPTLGSDDIRALLHETALAMTVLGKDSMPYEELDARLSAQNEELLDRVQRVTQDAPLTSLMISYFFKGGRSELGAEFLHKSFREYLFAEALVEILKSWDRQHDRDLVESPAADYWRDFPPDDPRYHLSRRLGPFLSAQWISPEVGAHLKELVAWEIGRSYGATAGDVIGKSLPSLDLVGWRRIRDALADLWDWWGEGVHLPDQPARKGKVLDHWDPAYANELLRECLPKTKSEMRGAPRLTVVDAHLGDGLFRLAAHIHQYVASRPDDAPAEPRDMESEAAVRRYQSAVQIDGRREKRFKPSGAHPSYFANYVDRINAAGWRPGYLFPGGIACGSLDFTRTFLNTLVFADADLRGSCFAGAEINVAAFVDSDVRGADFRGASLLYSRFIGTKVAGADFTGAAIHPAASTFESTPDATEALGVQPALAMEIRQHIPAPPADIGPQMR